MKSQEIFMIAVLSIACTTWISYVVLSPNPQIVESQPYVHHKVVVPEVSQ